MIPGAVRQAREEAGRLEPGPGAGVDREDERQACAESSSSRRPDAARTPRVIDVARAMQGHEAEGAAPAGRRRSGRSSVPGAGQLVAAGCRS